MAERPSRHLPLFQPLAATPAQRSRAGRQILVIGLGRFGSALATELESLGFEVLGVDTEARRVQDHAERLTHVVQADTTEAGVLRQLGAAEFHSAVVGIGSDVEASILTTAALADLGVRSIWAKAVTEPHGRILERVGAHRVIFPEHDMGQRVAHLVGGRMLDWFQLDEDFAMVETEAPPALVGRSLAESNVRAQYGVTVVAIKPAGGQFTYATPDTVLADGDVLVVAGSNKHAEAFADLG
ncbi:MAG TPA: TrkA family potassium uptake protein [Acidimicrobiales bacterium]|nr:TrkA family potassium uptake protein [Acidimicrobiales bacterium]